VSIARILHHILHIPVISSDLAPIPVDALLCTTRYLHASDSLTYLFYPIGISLIEWPSRLSQHPQLLPNPQQLLEIYISIRSSSDERVVTLKALGGSSWADRLQQLETEGMVDDLMI
jgi:hypothetical protein